MANEYLRQSDLRDLTALTPEEEQSRIYAEQLADQGGVGVSLEQELARAKDPRVREALQQELANRGSDYSRDEWVPASNPVSRRRPKGMSEISKALLEGVDDKSLADLDYDKMVASLSSQPAEQDKASGTGFGGSLKRGAVVAMQQMPQLAYGLFAGMSAIAESAFGEGGVSTAAKDWSIGKYGEWEQKIQANSRENDSLTAAYEKAKGGDFGALVDWLGYGIGYGLSQGAQMIATGGVGSIAGKAMAKGAAEKFAAGMVEKQVAAGMTREAAVASVASQLGQMGALGASAYVMEGGEIFGDMTKANQGHALTGEQIAKGLGATLMAGSLEFVGDKLGYDTLMGKYKFGFGKMDGLSGRAARGGAAAVLNAPAEGATEFFQTGLEEWGKGNEANMLPWNQSDKAYTGAIDAAGLGAVGGGAHGMIGGILSSPTVDQAIAAADESLNLNQSLDQAAPELTPAVTAYQQDVLAQPAPAGEFAAMDQQAQLPEFEKQLNADRDAALAGLLQGQKREEVDTTIDPVRGYVEEQRRIGTPAAMEFVRQFENGTITPEQVQQQINTEQSRLGKTDADIRIENAAAESTGQDMVSPAPRDARTQQMQNSTLAMQANQAQRAQMQQTADNESGQFSKNRTSQQQAADVQSATAPVQPPAPAVGRVTKDVRDLSAKVKGNPQINDVTVEAMAGKVQTMPKLVAHTVQKLGKMLGRRVVFFSGGGVDGTVFRDKNDNRIFVNADASVNPIRVLGHEMMHRLKTESPAAYASLRKALREGGIITDEMLADYDRDYNGEAYKGIDEAGAKARRDAVLAEIKAGNSEHLLEEMLSDLNGNRFMESDFWGNVFQKIEQQEGREKAKGIIAKLREALTLLISKLQKALSGSKEFAADKQILENLQQVRAALEDAFATYMGDLKKAGNRLEEMAGEGGEGAAQSKARDLFEDDFADKDSTVGREVVVSSKGAKEEVRLGNINSAGRQIAPTRQALENFWKWYGDGPVDENGRPVLLYHSTNADITAFEPGRETTNNYGILGDVTTSRAGIFASPNADFSQEYIRSGDGGNVMPIYMALQNPFDLRDGFSAEMERELSDAGVNTRIFYQSGVQQWELFDNDDNGQNVLVDTLKKLGYDGAIIWEENQGGEAQQTYVAFSPEQIKSAAGNRGTFDANNPDISLSPRRNDPAWNDALKMWLAMSSHNELFKYPKSEHEKMQDIFADIMPEAKVSERFLLDDRDKRYDVVKKWIVTVGDGRKVTIYQDKKGDVWVNAAGLKTGKSEGAAVYAALLNYTHNNMLRMVGDPLGVSDLAVFRRTENMLASALKFGTTDHMMPADEQARPEYFENQMGHLPGVTDKFEPLRWDQSGDHLANLTNLLYSSYSNVKSFVPEIENVIYNFRAGRFEWAGTDRVVTAAEWKVLSRALREGLSGISSPADRIESGLLGVESGKDQRGATLQRAALTNTLLREPSAEVRGSLLAEVRSKLREHGLDDDLTGISYSPKRGDESQRVFFEVAPDPRNPALKKKWDALSDEKKQEISDQVKEKVIPGLLRSIGVEGEIEPQFGGWMDDTSPSFALVVRRGDALGAMKAIGYALNQEAVYALGDKPFDGAEKTGIIYIDVAGKDQDGVHETYMKIRSVDPEAVSGHSTIDGLMMVGVPLEKLASIKEGMDRAFDGEHIEAWDVVGYGATVKEYGYGELAQGTPAQQPLAERDVDRWKTEADRIFGEGIGAKLSTARSDGAGSAAGGSVHRSAGEGSRPGSVSATGIHYSQEKRSFLDSGYFGRGTKSEELERVMDAPDERIKHRIYFYVNEGRGIHPENGVGSHAHKYDLTNLYDLTADRDDLLAKFWRNKNTMESAILDAGYDGWTGGGIAILLGKRSIVPEYVGQFVKPEVAEREYSEKSPYGKLQQAVVKNNSLPGGEMSGADWKRLMPKLMPEVDVSHLEDDKRYYKDQIVKRPDATDQGGVSLSTARAQTETPEFKKWFGDSKVVDADGKPRIVYHGTNSDTNEFSAGTFFTSSKSIAGEYASRRGGDRIEPVYLSIKNPLVVNASGDFWDDVNIGGINLPPAQLRKIFGQAMQSTYTTEEIADAVRNSGIGYDGVVFNGVKDAPTGKARKSDVFVTFAPGQIKSATGNKGSFDASKPDIRMSPQRWYFSNLERQIESAPDKVFGPAKQVKAWLQSNAGKLGIKKDELSVMAQPDSTKDINQFLGRWESSSKSLDAVMNNGVIASREHDQVIKAIVDAIPVDVVNVLSSHGIDAKDFSSNPKMYFDHLPADVRLTISNGFADALSSVGARLRAGLRSAYETGLDKKILSTLKASDLTLDEAVRIFSHSGGNKGEMIAGSAPVGASARTENRAGSLALGRGKNGSTTLADFVDWFQGISPHGVSDGDILLQNSFTITDAMREKVSGGLPLFSRTRGWDNFPDAVIGHRSVQQSEHYAAAKDGDLEAAIKLARLFVTPDYVAKIKKAIGDKSVIFAPVRSAEQEGSANAIPEAVAGVLADRAGGALDEGGIRQQERIGRGGSDGWGRIANQPKFRGEVIPGANYVIVDDTLTQGGTLAQLKEFIENNGGNVILATTLTGKQYSAKIGLSQPTLSALREKLGSIEPWFRESFGFGFEGLTESEARYLVSARGLSPDAVRGRIVAAMREGTDGDPQSLDSQQGAVSNSTRRIIGNSGRQHTPDQIRAFERTGRIFDEKSLLERVKEFVAKRWQQGIFDQFAPFRNIDMGAYTLMRLSKGATGAMEALMHHGKLSLRDGTYDADTTGGVIDKVFAPIGKETTDFLYWVAGNRAERLKREGKENLMDDRDIQAFKALDNGVTNFDYTLSNGQVTRDRTRIYADTLKKFNSFNKNVLDMAEQSGLIDPASRQFWEHEFYVPFYRVLEEQEISGGNIAKGVVRQKAFEKLKGGDKQLNDLLANTLMNWHHLIDAGAKNRAAKAAVEAADRMGIAHRAIPGEKKTVWFMDNGQKREYKIDDPAVMEAITGLEYAGMRNLVMDALTAPKHWLTMGVTASPFFKIRNLIRDSVQAIGTSDLSYNPIKNISEGIKLTNRDRQEYVSALAGGGLIRFGTMLEGNEAARTRQLIKKASKDGHILDGEGALQKFYDKWLEPGVAAYNELGNRGEEINRMSLYDQLIKQGVDHATASLMARDLLDFSLQGNFTTIRFLAQVVPFFNARMQGLYKLGRATKENRAHMATVIFTAAVASLALMALAASDDDSWKRWKKREEWDKSNYWFFMFGGMEFRIPKPFEIGAVAHIAERSVEAMFDSERDAGKRYGKAMMDVALNQLSFNPVPQAIKPIVDLYANKDSFTGRPIETMGMQRLAPTERYTSQTSMPARLASEATFGMLSPVQYDHLVRSYFGWLGATSVGSADMIARAINNEPTKPALDYFKFATGGMVQEDQIASRYLSMMYEQAAELEQAHATYARMVKEGRRDEAKEFAEDNADKLKSYRQVENVKKQVSQINERIRMIERSDLHPAEKRIKIRELKERASDIAARLSN